MLLEKKNIVVELYIVYHSASLSSMKRLWDFKKRVLPRVFSDLGRCT